MNGSLPLKTNGAMGELAVKGWYTLVIGYYKYIVPSYIGIIILAFTNTKCLEDNSLNVSSS